MRPLVALFGPTSSGKTRLSIDLCRRLVDRLGLDPVVISADSRQVYRYLDIGTSKTMPEQMAGFRHEMISVADPARKYELESYVAAARGHLEACWSSGRFSVVVGGTAVYVQALLEGWAVDGTAAARSALRRDFPRAMAADAYATLRRVDRQAAARIHPNNYDAVINALAARTGEPGGAAAPGGVAAPAAAEAIVLGLDRPARELDVRVARTFDEQRERGLFEEVVGLADRYGLDRAVRRRGADHPNQVLHTHGYREFFDVARERGRPVRSLDADDLAAVRERVLDHIRAYTRRQRGAFGKLPGLRMVRSAEAAYRLVARACPDR